MRTFEPHIQRTRPGSVWILEPENRRPLPPRQVLLLPASQGRLHLRLDDTAREESRLLYVYLGSARSARDSELVGHPHQLRQRPRDHFVHDLAPMNADGDLAGTEVSGGLLVREACDHEGKDLPFTRREQSVMLLQLDQFGSLLPRFSINGNGGVNRLQQLLLAERLRQKLDSSGLHRTH